MKKSLSKKFLALLLTLVFLVGMFPILASAATYTTVADLQTALNTAVSGNTVTLDADLTVAPGETITVPAGVTLAGDNGAALVLTGALTGSGVIKLEAEAKLDGLVIDAAAATPASSIYAVFPVAEGATITGCKFLGAYDSVSNPNYNLIAIGVGGGSSAIGTFTISGNEFDGVRQPVNVNFAPPEAGAAAGRLITGNTITNTKGIVVWNTSLVTISGNTYSNNVVDIALISRGDGTGGNASVYSVADVIALSAAEDCLVDMQGAPSSSTHTYFNSGALDNTQSDSNPNALKLIIDNAAAGAVIKLSAGTYEIDATLLIDKPNITIEGIGDVTIKAKAPFSNGDTSGCYYYLLSAITGADNLTLKNIKFDANNVTAERYGGGDKPIGNINLFDVSGTVIEDCSASNGSLGLCINSSTVTVTDFSTSGNSWGGINLSQGSGLTEIPVLTIQGKYTFDEQVAMYDDTTALVATVNAPRGWSYTDDGGVRIWTYTAPGYLPPITTTPPGGTPIEDEDTPLGDLPIDKSEEFAQALYELGLFKGIGNDADGNPVFALDAPLTRMSALILTLRLFGLEDAALAYEGENPFEDLTGEVALYASFAYENGITKGVSDELFAPDELVTFQQFATFVLRSLGYSDDELGEFVYAEAISFAVETGLVTEEMAASFTDGSFLRGDSVTVMVCALLTYVNGSEDTTLLDKLVEDGVIAAEAAEAFIAAIAEITEAAAE